MSTLKTAQSPGRDLLSSCSVILRVFKAAGEGEEGGDAEQSRVSASIRRFCRAERSVKYSADSMACFRNWRVAWR